jgi:hypothetical protein
VAAVFPLRQNDYQSQWRPSVVDDRVIARYCLRGSSAGTR